MYHKRSSIASRVARAQDHVKVQCQSSPAREPQAQRRCLRAQCNEGFGTGPHTQLSSVKEALDLDSVEREDDPSIRDAVKNPGVEPCCDIALYGLYVTFYAPCRFSNRHGTASAHGLQQLPALPSQYLPQ
jgi:hypothetical protein